MSGRASSPGGSRARGPCASWAGALTGGGGPKISARRFGLPEVEAACDEVGPKGLACLLAPEPALAPLYLSLGRPDLGHGGPSLAVCWGLNLVDQRHHKVLKGGLLCSQAGKGRLLSLFAGTGLACLPRAGPAKGSAGISSAVT